MFSYSLGLKETSQTRANPQKQPKKGQEPQTGIIAEEDRARICKPFKEPRNRFSAWRAGTTILLE
jgi:hypothetical protein